MMNKSFLQRKSAMIVPVSAVLICASAVVFASSRPVRVVRSGALSLMRPLMRVADNAGRRIGSGTRAFFSGFCGACDEERTARELSDAKAAHLAAENESLKKMLGLKHDLAGSVKPAQVLAYNQEWDREWLMIDVGEEDGVRIGDPVVDEDQLLIGDIAEAGSGFATVAIASDKGSAFGVSFTPSGAEGLAKGIGARAFDLTLIPHDASAAPGDMIMRISKIGKKIPAIFAARVVSTDDRAGGPFKTGRATLLAHPEQLDRVMVITSL